MADAARGTLPATEINFLDSWCSAISGNFLRYFPSRAGIANYFLWNTITASQASRQG